MKIKRLILILSTIFVLSIPTQADDTNHVVSAIGQKIANAYGFESFSDVLELQYTFNVNIDGETISRSWIWNPQDKKVTYIKDGVSYSYLRDNISKKSDDIKELDSKFINDQYWLIFPFQLAWDEGIRVDVEDEKVDLPLGSGSSTMVRITYPDTGGYTPGDVYELFLDENYMITKWIYRRGGSDTPTRVTSWEENTKFGPITISLNRQDPDSNFRVWFTDVVVVTN